MTTNAKSTNDNVLRVTIRKLDAHTAQEIRDAYYKAVEGLRSLADALEMADSNSSEAGDDLLAEHLIACEAIQAMSKSQLGRIL